MKNRTLDSLIADYKAMQPHLTDLQARKRATAMMIRLQEQDKKRNKR